MFLIDSICNYRSTEPIWFRFLKSFFAIILAMILIYYSFTQFKNIGRKVSVNIVYEEFKGLDLNVTMCTNDVKFNVFNLTEVTELMNLMEFEFSFQNHTFYCQSLLHNYNVPTKDTKIDDNYETIGVTAPFNINHDDNIINILPKAYRNRINGTYRYLPNIISSIPLNISNNLLLLSFESFEFNYKNLHPDLISFNKTIRETVSPYPEVTLEPTYFLLYLGQAFIISFKPTFVSDFVFTENLFPKYELKLKPRLEKQPMPEIKSNETRFTIRPLSNLIKFEDWKRYNFENFLANIGGFYGAIAGIFVLFFGMPKHEPWGLTQKYILSCVPCRRSFAGNFAKKYVSIAGIPLAEKVHKRPEGSSLEDRVQILETLLQDYYLDDYYLKNVKNIKIQHKKFLRKMDQQKNENTELEVPLISSEK